MAAVKDHKLLLKRLQKQIRRLQKKEEQSRARLKNALIRIRQLSKSYQSKLATSIRIMTIKMGRVKTPGDAHLGKKKRKLKGRRSSVRFKITTVNISPSKKEFRKGNAFKPFPSKKKKLKTKKTSRRTPLIKKT